MFVIGQSNNYGETCIVFFGEHNFTDKLLTLSHINKVLTGDCTDSKGIDEFVFMEVEKLEELLIRNKRIFGTTRIHKNIEELKNRLGIT